MNDLRWGWGKHDVERLAWRAARQAFDRLLPMHERADIAQWAIWVALCDADRPPATLELLAAYRAGHRRAVA